MHETQVVMSFVRNKTPDRRNPAPRARLDVKKPVNSGINYQPQLVQDFLHQHYHSDYPQKIRMQNHSFRTVNVVSRHLRLHSSGAFVMNMLKDPNKFQEPLLNTERLKIIPCPRRFPSHGLFFSKKVD